MDNQNTFNFKHNIEKGLADSELRANLKFATNTLRAKRKALFADPEETRAEGNGQEYQSTGSLKASKAPWEA